MNITELARILRITPKELREYLPQFGYDIGRKAIKINKNVANKIIKAWPTLRRKIEQQKADEAKKAEEKKMEMVTEKEITIPSILTVRDFSSISGLPINVVLAELMKNGIFASLNEKIDYDTAWLVGSSVGIEVLKQDENSEEAINPEDNELKEILDKEKEKNMKERAPVIVVMGHVDHGKTRLLDAVRKTNIIEGEAGGITQHIGAYQVTRRKRLITFIDTPGHEAFTAMRSRGAKIADIAILVVAADDGVKPQTVEAFKIIEASKIPYVVAINKIDKADANIEKTKQELSNKLGIVPEDWGGKIICCPISAKDGTGITDLLDMVLLASETESENLKANPLANAVGTVIESHVDKGKGPVATILIQNGTLSIGDSLILNEVNIGKVRNLNNYLNENISTASPSTPVQIIGLKTAPTVGDIVKVGSGKKVNHKKLKYSVATKTQDAIIQTEEEDDSEKVNIMIKCDVLGSAEAIEESLEKINTKLVKVKIINKGLGNVTEGDIRRAESSKAQIVGFNVKSSPVVEESARERKVTVRTYHIIYDLLNDIKTDMQKLVRARIERTNSGRLKVLAIFISDKDRQIIGGKVLDEKIEKDSLVEIIRDKEVIDSGVMVKLQSGKQEVDQVEEGEDCGIEYKGREKIEEGDILQIYKEVEIIEKL
jgi:translation initiation factor IF-2